MLKAMYHVYHFRCCINRKAYLSFKKRDLILTATPAVITTGGLAGSTVFLPAVGIGACGIVLAVIVKYKNYPRKIEMCRSCKLSTIAGKCQLCASMSIVLCVLIAKCV